MATVEQFAIDWEQVAGRLGAWRSQTRGVMCDSQVTVEFPLGEPIPTLHSVEIILDGQPADFRFTLDKTFRRASLIEARYEVRAH